MPPTEIYNENWLLRVVLETVERSGAVDHPFTFLPEARWYSEGLLRPAFLPEPGGKRIGEGFTHSDGAIGHFDLAGEGGAEIILAPTARQFVIIEGKLGSPLSKGVSNAPDFDQAARNVACMANVVARAGLAPRDLERFAFYAIAPRAMIEYHRLTSIVAREPIGAKVRARAGMYDGDRDSWFAKAFEPALDAITLAVLTWEDVLTDLVSPDLDLRAFYAECLECNRVGGV